MTHTFEEIKGFEQQLVLVVQKLNALRQSLILQVDPTVIFKTETEIAQLEMQKRDLQKQLSEAYDLGTDSGKSRLREQVAQLRITEPMGRLHLVNCNRQEVRDRFEAGFDQWQNMGALNHFYFLSACPTQLPASLGECIVYELLSDLLDEKLNAVFCPVDQKNHDRVKLNRLPLGYSLEKSQEMFRDFCAEWFRWSDKQPFEEAIAANRLPLPRCRFAVLPFYVRKKEWKTFFPEYFDWIARQLAKRPAGGPTVLAFIVFYLENLHNERDEKAAEILSAIDGLCAKHPHARHFYPLDPVPLSDLRDWFTDLGEHNTARLDPVFRTLAEGLPEEEYTQFRRSQLLNMDRIELVQELVFELYNQ